MARFVALLKEERDALNSGNIDLLDALLAQKNKVAAELQVLAEQRNKELVARSLGTDRNGLEAWLAAHPSNQPARQAWSQVLLLAKEARDLNRENGELIQLRMRHNALALEALLGASRQPNLYGPDGQSAPQSNRRINDAA